MKAITNSFKFTRLFILVLFFSFFLSPALAKAEVSSAEIIELTNRERVGLGLGALSYDPVLTVAAEKKANDMAAKGYFSHNTPDGKTPWQFMDEVGYGYLSAGENLAVDYFSNEEVIKAWMNSPGHRANIANANFREIGVAFARGTYQGRSTIFIVQMFGVPNGSQPAPVLEEKETASLKMVNSEAVVPIVVPEISETVLKGTNSSDENTLEEVKSASDTRDLVLEKKDLVVAPVVVSELGSSEKEIVNDKEESYFLTKEKYESRVGVAVSGLEPQGKKKSGIQDTKNINKGVFKKQIKSSPLRGFVYTLRSFFNKISLLWKRASISVR